MTDNTEIRETSRWVTRRVSGIVTQTIWQGATGEAGLLRETTNYWVKTSEVNGCESDWERGVIRWVMEKTWMNRKTHTETQKHRQPKHDKCLDKSGNRGHWSRHWSLQLNYSFSQLLKHKNLKHIPSELNTFLTVIHLCCKTELNRPPSGVKRRPPPTELSRHLIETQNIIVHTKPWCWRIISA